MFCTSPETAAPSKITYQLPTERSKDNRSLKEKAEIINWVSSPVLFMPSHLSHLASVRLTAGMPLDANDIYLPKSVAIVHRSHSHMGYQSLLT